MTSLLFFVLVVLAALRVLTLIDYLLADILSMFSMMQAADKGEGAEYLVFTVSDVRRMRKEIHLKEVKNK